MDNLHSPFKNVSNFSKTLKINFLQIRFSNLTFENIGHLKDQFFGDIHWRARTGHDCPARCGYTGTSRTASNRGCADNAMASTWNLSRYSTCFNKRNKKIVDYLHKNKH